MTRQLTVDFNEELDDGLLLANDRNAAPGARIAVGARLVVGDDDAGVCLAEVIDYEHTTGLLTLRLLDEQLSDAHAHPATRPQ
jgi:hypothetical protein